MAHTGMYVSHRYACLTLVCMSHTGMYASHTSMHVTHTGMYASHWYMCTHTSIIVYAGTIRNEVCMMMYQ